MFGFMIFSKMMIQPSIMVSQVAALFHIGTTKAHPPIPEHLSEVAKDFLLKCLRKYASLPPFLPFSTDKNKKKKKGLARPQIIHG